MPSGGGGGGAMPSGGGGGASAGTAHGVDATTLFSRGDVSVAGGCVALGGGCVGGVAEGEFAANVWSFIRILAASTTDCPFISDSVPVTVIFAPLRIAGPSWPPRPGVTSMTLPFWR
jgi:hypothetical protein